MRPLLPNGDGASAALPRRRGRLRFKTRRVTIKIPTGGAAAVEVALVVMARRTWRTLAAGKPTRYVPIEAGPVTIGYRVAALFVERPEPQ